MADPIRLSLELLEGLEERWRRQGAPLADRLQPGLSRGEIERLMAPLGLQLPHEVELWWSWHNGVAASGAKYLDRAFGPDFAYLPLAEAVERYTTMRRIATEVASAPGTEGESADPEFWWQPSWFPILGTGYGAVITCDCARPPESPAPIFSVWWATNEVPNDSAASSFGEAVTWWIEALDTGVWKYDPEAKRWELNRDLLEDPRRTFTGLV